MNRKSPYLLGILAVFVLCSCGDLSGSGESDQTDQTGGSTGADTEDTVSIYISDDNELSSEEESTVKEEDEKARKAEEQEALTRKLIENQEERMRLFRRPLDVNCREGQDALRNDELEKAENLFLVSLQQMDSYRKEPGLEAVIANNLASIYERKEMYAQALPLYNRAQKLFIRAYGRKYPGVILALTSMGRILGKEARWYEAASVYRNALKLVEESEIKGSPQHIELLEAYIHSLRLTGQGLRLAEMQTELDLLKKGATDKSSVSEKSNENSK